MFSPHTKAEGTLLGDYTGYGNHTDYGNHSVYVRHTYTIFVYQLHWEKAGKGRGTEARPTQTSRISISGGGAQARLFVTAAPQPQVAYCGGSSRWKAAAPALELSGGTQVSLSFSFFRHFMYVVCIT